MPMTGFARMMRSDHSMLPPTSGATGEFASPNACNLCHRDKEPDWADRLVRKWHGSSHQDLILHRASLIKAARNRDWDRLPEMLDYLNDPGGDEVFKTSLVRLLISCPYEEKWQVLFELAKDSSPLLRSAALSVLSDLQNRRALDLLVRAAGHGPRLVRVRAASALASFPLQMLSPGQRDVVEAAAKELVQAILARPDTWQAYYNLGNYRLGQGRITKAQKACETALGISGYEIMPMVKLALACAQRGGADCSLKYLIRAREKEPENPVVNLNLGLFWAEKGKNGKAEKSLRLAFLNDPKLARAAYNLGLLLVEKSPAEGAMLCLKAYEFSPNPKYAATAAFWLKGQQKTIRAARLLEKSIDKWPGYTDRYLLLARMHREKGLLREAEKVPQKGLNSGRMFGLDKKRLLYQLGRLQSGGPAD
ncbi:hypothetical protein X474_08865 [Dethiosulfatarculus sandiegensis]|uniref:Uncharacterized protein n=2 Tax=Dethiosulfatarculus sandiegensis TaxID=1429043 RepID=A0A0D2JF74_9BACT|nr:hypothetical protein X474_08865 [Dethiosulfatarculus sandiegensis]